jgi:hypothetical protein
MAHSSGCLLGACLPVFAAVRALGSALLPRALSGPEKPATRPQDLSPMGLMPILPLAGSREP